MGFGPQLVDLDGDGHRDVISGSWPGQLYLFRGQPDGTFAAGAILDGHDGRPISLGSASVVHAADWNGNGQLDLLVGNIQGEVYVVPHEGASDSLTFGEPRPLEAGGQPIRVPGGDSGPFVVDWDGDGQPDLIIGAGDGSVLWFRNEGSAQKPVLASAQTLVPASTGQEEPMSPGRRAKVCVTDWNEDGRLDLLVGDFAMEVIPPPEPDEAEDDEAKRAEAQAKLDTLLQEHRALQQGPEGETPEAREARRGKLNELGAEIIALMRTVRGPQTAPRYEYHGRVWLFLRQDVEAEGVAAVP